MTLNDLLEILDSPEAIQMARTTSRGFSLAQKITLRDVVLFYMQRMGCTINQDIAAYFSKVGKPRVTKQGMFKALDKLNPEFFPYVIRELANKYYERGDYQTLNGYIVLACDGTKLDLPNTPELAEKFGGAKNQTVTDTSKIKTPQANCSVLVDVLNHVVLNASMCSYDTSELPMLFEHLEKCRDLLKGKKVLLLCDRYYVSAELFLYCTFHEIDFIVRNKSYCYKEHIAKVKTEGLILLDFDKAWINRMKREDCKAIAKLMDNCLALRVVKNTYSYKPTDKKRAEEVQVDSAYLTSVSVPLLSKGEVVSAYHVLRWDNETVFYDIKDHLEVERFNSGKVNIVINSYLAKVLNYMIGGQFFNDADELNMSRKDEEGQTTKYDYIPNMKNILDTLRIDPIFPKILHCQEIRITVPDIQKYVEDLVEDFSRVLVPVRPGRHYQRWGKWMASIPLRKFRLDGRRDPPIKKCPFNRGYITSR